MQKLQTWLIEQLAAFADWAVQWLRQILIIVAILVLLFLIFAGVALLS